MSFFGTQIRSLREARGLLIRQVAAAIELDQALLSKIERGERQATKAQVLTLADFFSIDQDTLLSRWMGEKIADELQNEGFAEEALKIAASTIKARYKQEKEIAQL